MPESGEKCKVEIATDLHLREAVALQSWTSLNMSISRTLLDFITHEDQGAMVLQGRWGVGKTYLWKLNVIRPFLADPSIENQKKRYSYVSLFGIQTIEELKAAIFQSSNEFDSEKPSKWRFFSPRWLWWKTKKLLPHAISGASIPYVSGGSITNSYNALTFYTIRNRLICLDDIERRGTDLKMIDVLGLISYLSEQRRCRVIVILNSDALEEEDQDVWNKTREKVFLGELTFDPDISQTIDLGLTDASGEPWADLARDCLSRLRVSNIRIVHRAKRSIRRVLDKFSGTPLREETVERLVKVLVMLEYAQNGRGSGAPPIDFVLKSGPWDFTLMTMTDTETSEDEKRWAELISSYDIYFGQEMDMALAAMVKAGYPDYSELDRVLQAHEQHAAVAANKNEYHKAWRLYHDTLEENSEEFLDEIERTWPLVSAVEGAHNLDPIVHLLREFGRGEVASRFIQEWIQHRSGDRNEELNERSLSMFRKISDPEILEATSAAYRQERKLPDLPTALQRISGENGFDQEAIQAIAMSTIEDLKAVLVANPGRYLSSAISNTLHLGSRQDEPTWEQAAENMRAALEQLAMSSPFQADRIANKFGVRAGDSGASAGQSVGA